jgi:beta-lactamase class A
MMLRNQLSIVFSTIFILVQSQISFAQKGSLKDQIDQIVGTSNGEIGIAVMGLESREKFLFRENQKFPMQSVFKFPLAMAVLDRVDKGQLKLDQKIHITKEDLLPKTWSPVREKYPEGNVDLTLAELLGYTVSQSDNNICDLLFRLAGGTEGVDKYIKSLGVKGIAIAATELEMSRHWDVQFTNWCQPPAMLQILDILYQGKKLSKASNDFLWKIMTETATGPRQIKGLLPKDILVAHKTGSSGTNEKGITAATNDVGIITLPNGKHLAIVLFLTNSPDRKDKRDELMAKIAKVSFDYYSSR